MHALVDLFAQLGDLRLADPRQPHRLHQIVDPPGPHAADPATARRKSPSPAAARPAPISHRAMAVSYSKKMPIAGQVQSMSWRSTRFQETPYPFTCLRANRLLFTKRDSPQTACLR